MGFPRLKFPYLILLFITSTLAFRRISTGEEGYEFAADVENIVGEIKYGFSCKGRMYGYYADQEQDCQVFHICSPVPGIDGKTIKTLMFSFFCPIKTRFSQDLITCILEDLAYPCEKAHELYSLNNKIGKYTPKNKTAKIVETKEEAEISHGFSNRANSFLNNQHRFTSHSSGSKIKSKTKTRKNNDISSNLNDKSTIHKTSGIQSESIKPSQISGSVLPQSIIVGKAVDATSKTHSTFDRNQISSKKTNLQQQKIVKPKKISLTKTSLPKTTLQKTTLPRTSLPKTSLPKTTLRKSSLPKTSLSKTTLPKTSLPKSSLRKTTLTKSSLPKTSLPKTSITKTSKLPSERIRPPPPKTTFVSNTFLNRRPKHKPSPAFTIKTEIGGKDSDEEFDFPDDIPPEEFLSPFLPIHEFQPSTKSKRPISAGRISFVAAIDSSEEFDQKITPIFKNNQQFSARTSNSGRIGSTFRTQFENNQRSSSGFSLKTNIGQPLIVAKTAIDRKLNRKNEQIVVQNHSNQLITSNRSDKRKHTGSIGSVQTRTNDSDKRRISSTQITSQPDKKLDSRPISRVSTVKTNTAPHVLTIADQRPIKTKKSETESRGRGRGRGRGSRRFQLSSHGQQRVQSVSNTINHPSSDNLAENSLPTSANRGTTHHASLSNINTGRVQQNSKSNRQKTEQKNIEQQRILERERIRQEQIEHERDRQDKIRLEKIRQQEIENERKQKSELENQRLEKLRQHQLAKQKIKQEKLKQEKSKEKLKQDNIKREELRQGHLRQDQLREEKFRQEERAKQEQIRREQNKQENIRKERLRQSQIEQDNIRHEQIQHELIRQQQIKEERLRINLQKAAPRTVTRTRGSRRFTANQLFFNNQNQVSQVTQRVEPSAGTRTRGSRRFTGPNVLSAGRGKAISDTIDVTLNENNNIRHTAISKSQIKLVKSKHDRRTSNENINIIDQRKQHEKTTKQFKKVTNIDTTTKDTASSISVKPPKIVSIKHIERPTGKVITRKEHREKSIEKQARKDKLQNKAIKKGSTDKIANEDIVYNRENNRFANVRVKKVENKNENTEIKVIKTDREKEIRPISRVRTRTGSRFKLTNSDLKTLREQSKNINLNEISAGISETTTVKPVLKEKKKEIKTHKNVVPVKKVIRVIKKKIKVKKEEPGTTEKTIQKTIQSKPIPRTRGSRRFSRKKVVKITPKTDTEETKRKSKTYTKINRRKQNVEKTTNKPSDDRRKHKPSSDFRISTNIGTLSENNRKTDSGVHLPGIKTKPTNLRTSSRGRATFQSAVRSRKPSSDFTLNTPIGSDHLASPTIISTNVRNNLNDKTEQKTSQRRVLKKVRPLKSLKLIDAEKHEQQNIFPGMKLKVVGTSVRSSVSKQTVEENGSLISSKEISQKSTKEGKVLTDLELEVLRSLSQVKQPVSFKKPVTKRVIKRKVIRRAL